MKSREETKMQRIDNANSTQENQMKMTLLQKAQAWAETTYSPCCKRRWLTAGPTDSYEDESNRVQFWALEGSPAKAFIILEGPSAWGKETAIVLNGEFQVKKRYRSVMGQ